MKSLKFLRKDWHKKIRFKRKKKQKWRAPKGKSNKIRIGKKGHPPRPKIGYKKSKKKEIKIIENLKHLKELKKGEEVQIASKVGKRKREMIISEANKLGIKIKNATK